MSKKNQLMSMVKAAAKPGDAKKGPMKYSKLSKSAANC